MGAPLEDRDEVVRLLATGAPDQVRLRRDRLGRPWPTSTPRRS
jgi:hypothetical protein